MKVVFFSLLVLSSVAFAEVKPFGTFVAAECSTKSNPGKWGVCVGSKTGVAGTFVEVVGPNGQSQLLQIVKSRPGTNGGINPLMATAVMTLRDSKGNLASATANYIGGTLRAMFITLSNGFQLATTDFQGMMHTM